MNITDLQQALVVSCQPLPGSPMDSPAIIVAMAQAAVSAGARAVRIEGVDHVRAVVRALPAVPVIGIVKRDLSDTDVRITPWLEDVQRLIQAGAAIIAFDGTQRPRPVDVPVLLAAVHQAGRLAMADCSTLEDGLYCHHLGVDLIGTTLSGYTAETMHIAQIDRPDYALMQALSAAGATVVAEGRIRSAAEAAQALQAGAWCVTVGSAITRIEHITEWFVQAMAAASSSLSDREPRDADRA